MKRIVALGFFVLMTSSLFAQRLDYDTDSKWFWGINAGAAWNTTDVKNKTNGAWGLILGKSFNYNYGKKISFDIRGRYLGGKWKGQDYDTTSLLNYNPTSNVFQKYDTLGYTVNNFQTQVHEFGLELVIHANGLRENTGWDPYIFGGINLSVNQTKGNLLYEDTLTTDEFIYNYSPDGISRSDWRDISDNNYDLALEGSSQNSYNWDLMPSLGFGLAYQIAPRVSFGIEHKTTFAMKDVFDGYTDPTEKWGISNDMYHYTSAFLKFNMRKRDVSGDVNANQQNTNNGNFNGGQGGESNCFEPKIRISQPRNSSITVYSNQYQIKGLIEELAGRENIVFKVNGMTSTNFIYNPNNEQFESIILLSPGSNSIVIHAGNACGTDQETININYVNCTAPIVQFVNPQGVGISVSNSNFVVNATVLNAKRIEYFVNGVRKSNFSHNLHTGNFSSNEILNNDENTIRIVATNECGIVEELTSVFYTNCVDPFISVLDGYGSQITDKQVFKIRSKVLNVTNHNNISFRQNGMNKSFVFNLNTKIFEATVNLVQGTNTFVLFASNGCGSDSETITIESVPCKLPNVRITSPTNGISSTNAALVNATIENINNINQIKLLVNGIQVTGGSFNSSTNVFQANITLQVNSNVIEIIATNECGTSNDETNILFSDCTDPEVTVILPSASVSPTNTQLVKASVLNITNSNQIQLIVNGINVDGGSFNSLTKIFQANIVLQNDLNTIEIVATNNCGTDKKIINLRYTPCSEPIITIISPTLLTTTATTVLVQTTILNINNLSQVQLIVNGVLISGGSFNTTSHIFQANVALQNGGNTINIIAINDCGKKRQNIFIQQKGEDNEDSNDHDEEDDNDEDNEDSNDHNEEDDNDEDNEDSNDHDEEDDNDGDNEDSNDHDEEDDNDEDNEDSNDHDEEDDNDEVFITICHIDNRSNASTEMYIPISDWRKHQIHGDKLGPCPEEVEERTITICHLTYGGREKTQQIQIPISQWKQHQAHGDKLGPCSITKPYSGENSNTRDVEDAKVEIKPIERMITICHHSQNGQKNQIKIKLSNWAAHQSHGDHLGQCKEGAVTQVKEGKMTICHNDKKTGKTATLVIAKSEWIMHQSHGDSVGTCPPNQKKKTSFKKP